MSFGKKSPVYEPVSAEMLPFIGEHFPNVKSSAIGRLFDILTDRLHTETLLFVSIVSTLSRYLGGEKDDAGFGFGPGIRLSAISNDETMKMQTEAMELLHDVVVELPMAGNNYRMLQEYLAAEFGATIALYHSCGTTIIGKKDEALFYDRCGEEQRLRTMLDWTVPSLKDVSEKRVVGECRYTTRDAEVARECLNASFDAITKSKRFSSVAAAA